MKASAGMWLAALGLAPAPLVLAVMEGGRDGLRKNGSGATATDGGLAPVGAADGGARRKLALGNECVYAATDFPPDTDSIPFTAPVGVGAPFVFLTQSDVSGVPGQTVVYSKTLLAGCTYAFDLIGSVGATHYIQLLYVNGVFPITGVCAGSTDGPQFYAPIAATEQVYLAIDTAEGIPVAIYNIIVSFAGGSCTAPTLPPTSSPTAAPTSAPTSPPTAAPTSSPTSSPTAAPTAAPTLSPTSAPTSTPTAAPTSSPTSAPTSSPTAAPTSSPTAAPTSSPTAAPTSSPTAAPTKAPTPAPTSKSGKASAGKSGKASNGNGKTGKAALIDGDTSFLMDDGSMSASMSIDLGEEDLTFFNRRG
ncbi:hypothetical protein ACHAXT_009068 [Thalassiosira profunda]